MKDTKQFVNEEVIKLMNEYNGDMLKYCEYYIKDELNDDVAIDLYGDTVRDIDDEIKDIFDEIFYDKYIDAVNEWGLDRVKKFRNGELKDLDKFDLEWMNDCDDDELMDNFQEEWNDGLCHMNFQADMINKYFDEKKTWKGFVKHIEDKVEHLVDEVVQVKWTDYLGEEDFMYEGTLRDFMNHEEACNRTISEVADILIENNTWIVTRKKIAQIIIGDDDLEFV